MKETQPISISFNDSVFIALAINMVYFFFFLLFWVAGYKRFPYWQCHKDSTDYEYDECSAKYVSFLKAFMIPLIVIYIPIFLIMISSLEFRKWLGRQGMMVFIIFGFMFTMGCLMMYSMFVKELPVWMCDDPKKCSSLDFSFSKTALITSYAYMVFIVIVYLIQKRKNTQ